MDERVPISERGQWRERKAFVHDLRFLQTQHVRIDCRDESFEGGDAQAHRVDVPRDETKCHRAHHRSSATPAPAVGDFSPTLKSERPVRGGPGVLQFLSEPGRGRGGHSRRSWPLRSRPLCTNRMALSLGIFNYPSKKSECDLCMARWADMRAIRSRSSRLTRPSRRPPLGLAAGSVAEGTK